MKWRIFPWNQKKKAKQVVSFDPSHDSLRLEGKVSIDLSETVLQSVVQQAVETGQVKFDQLAVKRLKDLEAINKYSQNNRDHSI